MTSSAPFSSSVEPGGAQVPDVRDALAVVAGASEATAALAAVRTAGLGVGAPFAQAVLIVQRARLAGTVHMPHIDEILDELEPGDKLSFKRDPHNRDDEWSVRVFSPRGQLMGYVTADINQIVARLMDAGKNLYAVFVDVERVNSWNKVFIEVYLDD